MWTIIWPPAARTIQLNSAAYSLNLELCMESLNTFWRQDERQQWPLHQLSSWCLHSPQLSQFVSLRGADTWRRGQDLVTLVTLSPPCLVMELVLAPQHDNGWRKLNLPHVHIPQPFGDTDSLCNKPASNHLNGVSLRGHPQMILWIKCQIFGIISNLF